MIVRINLPRAFSPRFGDHNSKILKEKEYRENSDVTGRTRKVTPGKIRRPQGKFLVLAPAPSWWVLALSGSSLCGSEATTRERFIINS